MSYQVLARKWRPATFEQMVGQSHVLHALTNALSQQRLHHAYLFTGTRGVGKTSLARLFAKGLNCEQGVTATPCGVCGSCVEIAQGRFVDLIEVDAASRTKVDDTRELLDNVQYRPTRGRFKVYLIDEVHMLSRSSFNALLKTLEEPPEHVKFLLATTDPQKLPVTVLSRCLQFNLKSLTQQEIGTQLNHILTQEQFPFDAEALKLLAKAANGSMRDALSLTDQAIAFGGGTVMLTQVQTMLGSIDEQHVLRLLKALTDADIGVLMQTCGQVLAYGADAQEVLRSLLELLHQITLTQFAPAAAQQSLYSAQIHAFAEQLAPEQVQLYYQILLTGRKDLPYAPDPKSGLEMALLRAVAFVPEKSVKRWQVDAPAEVSLPSGQTPLSTAAVAPVAEEMAEKKTALIEPAVVKSKVAEPIVAESIVTESIATEPTEAGPAVAGSLATQVQVTPQADIAPQVKAALEVSVAPQTEVIVDETLSYAAENAALVAEQTLIISQAQSQGFSPQIEQLDANSDSGASISTEGSRTPSSVEQGVSGQAIADNGPLDYAYGEYAYYAEDPVSLDGYQDGYQDAHQDYDQIDHAYFFNGDSAALGQESTSVQGASSTSETPLSAASNSASQPLSVQNPPNPVVTTPLEDDDILSAVLAARESLLSDLEALSAKDGDEKKPSLDPKLKVPALGKSTAEPSVSARPVLNTQPTPSVMPAAKVTAGFDKTYVDEADFDEAAFDKADFSELSIDKRGFDGTGYDDKTNASTKSQLESNDRPPWEEAPTAAASTELIVSGTELVATSNELIPASTELAPQSSVDASALQSPPRASEAKMPSAQALSVQTSAAGGRETGLCVAEPISGDPLDLHWYKLMASLDVGGRVRQLAVNSVCQALEDPLPLLLKPDQKHLAADIAIEQLEQALTTTLGNPRRVKVVIGSDPKRETPLELRKRFHQELLQQAQQSLIKDDNVQWLIQRLGAELDTDTLVYPPELLNQRSQQIQALPEPT
ncbi:DNA polymerase III subunit gamma/tau [Shewanella putrefaciens]|uniref:DNA polymerase III subunit gamma/tau n=1 Tax=Shewanella putrefaciens TaxID=24 RepID=UPI0018E90344|nr:DNA polymerase III subunit gamma/tau [Shewanella putrefaciens]